MALESNRFFDINRNLLKGRRWATSGRVSISSDSDLSQAIEAIKRLNDRVGELEATRAPPWSEFEFDVTAGGTVRIEHGYGCPVRFTVTNWVGAAAPAFSKNNTSSTDDTLVLTSGVAG